jgi:hypothetical protein
MYKVIGADGKEYGPINADLIRQWIAEGRANGATKARLEGTTEWKTLGEFPEFAAALAARAVSLPPITPQPKVEPAFVQELLARDYDLDIGGCISRGFNLVFANFWLSVGAGFVVWLLVTIAGATSIGALLLTYVLLGGFDWMFLKLARGEKPQFSDAFAGFSLAFAPLLLFSLVAQVLTLLGVILCVLPGIYLAVSWLLFTPLLIIDKKMDFWPAMELSRKIVSRHWWQVFGLCLLLLLIHLGGVLLCCLGWFVAFPIIRAAKVYAYEEIFGSKAIAPATPPPSTT